MSDRIRIMNANGKMYFFGLLLAIVSLGRSGLALAAQDATVHPTWPGPGQLFCGACYQPIDRSPEQIDQDIAIMKRAGFNVVRMGDLSWDSFEPSQGKFTFEWFDRIMDKMQANGIRVILDIPVCLRPSGCIGHTRASISSRRTAPGSRLPSVTWITSATPTTSARSGLWPMR